MSLEVKILESSAILLEIEQRLVRQIRRKLEEICFNLKGAARPWDGSVGADCGADDLSSLVHVICGITICCRRLSSVWAEEIDLSSEGWLLLGGSRPVKEQLEMTDFELFALLLELDC